MLQAPPGDIPGAGGQAERGPGAVQPGQRVPRAGQAPGPRRAERPGPLPAGGARLPAAGRRVLRVSANAYSTLAILQLVAIAVNLFYSTAELII